MLGAVQMRRGRGTLVAIAVAAAIVAGAVPALADPPAGTVPAAHDIVGVADLFNENVCNQLSVNYDALRPGRRVFCWNAASPPALPGTVIPKQGCGPMARPGPARQVADLYITSHPAGGLTPYPCVDFALVSHGRRPTDPRYGAGGVAYVALARWALSYATQAVTDAPGNLTLTQLTAIYECTVTNWKQVGGKAAPISPLLPAPGSTVGASFLKAIGVTTVGRCVGYLTAQDDGTLAPLSSPTAIVPYAISAWIAQKFHSPRCGHAPLAGQNLFGCDEHGSTVLGSVNGVRPTVGTGVTTIPDPRFPLQLWFGLNAVVLYSTATADHIPAYMERVFGSHGWVCTAVRARADLADYGFAASPLCGTTF